MATGVRLGAAVDLARGVGVGALVGVAGGAGVTVGLGATVPMAAAVAVPGMAVEEDGLLRTGTSTHQHRQSKGDKQIGEE